MSDAQAESFKMWTADAQVRGPVDTATLIQWIQDDRVLRETFVQRQSDRRWRPAADIDSLRPKLPAAAATARAVSGSPPVVDMLREFPLFAGLTKEGVEQIAA